MTDHAIAHWIDTLPHGDPEARCDAARQLAARTLGALEARQ